MPGWERLAAGSGIGFVLASALAFLIVPDPPTADEGSDFIFNFVVVNDADLLWQAFFFGIGGILLLWFGGTLAAALRRLGRNPDDRLPAVITASTGAAVAMFLVGVICVGALASGIEQMDQGVAYGLYQVGSFAFVMTDFPAAAFVWAAAIGIARSDLLPKSVGYVGGIVGLLLVVNAGGRLLGDRADFAPGGTANTIVFAIFLFWVFVTSLFLMQRVAPARRSPES